MKKFLLLVMTICMGASASAQSVYTLATTEKMGAQGTRHLVSADERNICFRTTAQRMYAELDPAQRPQGAMDIIKSSRQVANETVLNTLPWINISTNIAETPGWNMNTSTDTYYADGSGNASHYVDLTDYNELRIYTDDKSGFRAIFFKSTGETDAWDIYGENNGNHASFVSWNDADKYWAVNLDNMPSDYVYNGRKWLKTIKSTYNTTGIVSSIKAVKYTTQVTFGGFTEVLSETQSTSNETVLNTLNWIQISDNSVQTPAWNMNTSTDTYYGNMHSDPTHYVDLTSYDELRIYRSTIEGFRAFFINSAGTNSKTVSSSSNDVSWHADGGYWAVDLSKVEKWNNKVALKSIKSASSDINNIVTNITVCNVTTTQNTIAREANCSYTYDADRGVGTFSYSNVRTGNASVNLFNNLKGNLTGYENFVIRTLNCTTPLIDVTQTDQSGNPVGQTINIRDYDGNVHGMQQTHRYCLQFCDEYNNVIHEVVIYSEDMKVIQLKEFFSDTDFNRINSVWLSTAGGDTDLSATVQIKEAYFITPYDLNKSSQAYPLGEYFYDMDEEYIGNAFIHPSYFMMSNGLTMDEQTGVLALDPYVHAYQDLSKTMYSSVADCNYKVGMTTTGATDGTDRFIYGNWAWSSTDYSDLANYDNMYVYFDSQKDAPVIMFNWDMNQQYMEINSSNLATYASIVDASTSGLWKIDIKAFIQAYDVAHLTFLKAPDDGQSLVSSVLLEKISFRGTHPANGEVNKNARIQLSVPFAGFDMSDVTMVSMDNAEDGDVIGRWICGYHDFFRQNNVPVNNRNIKDETNGGCTNKVIMLAVENENPKDIRTLYTSRYNAEFKPPTYDGTYANYLEKKNQVNNIWWETENRQEGTNADDRTESMTIYDICITKNHVITRNGGNHTKLSKDFYNNTDACTEIGTSGSTAGTTLYGDGGVTADNYADLTNYYKMQIKGTPNAEIRILSNRGVVSGRDLKETFVRLDSKGLAVVDLAQTIKDEEVYHLNAIKIPGTWGTEVGQTVIDYIKLYGEEDGVIDLNAELFHTWIRDENVPVTRRTGRYGTGYNNAGTFDNHVGTDETVEGNHAIFGTGDEFHPENYAELTGYKTLRVYGSEGMVPRIVFNCVNGSKTGEPKFNAIKKTIPAEGYVDFDLTPYAYFHLNTLKNDYGAQAGKVSRIALISDERVDYVLEGNGTLSETPAEAADHLNGGTSAIPYGGCALDAINDVGARVIDARPRVNLSRSTLVYPENPNCLYLMRANLTKKQSQREQYDAPFVGIDGNRYKDGNEWKGKTNSSEFTPSTDVKYYANMVKISGTLDEGTHNGDGYLIGNNGFNSGEINLFDGYSFSAPRDINVTSATLRRKTVGGEGNKKVGTLILPFAAGNINGTAYDTFASRYAQYPSEDNGILEDTHINKGDHVLLFEKHSGAVQAYWPYLYVASIAGEQTEFTYSGKIGKTPEVGSDKAPGEYMTNEAKANEAGQRHFLRGFMESTHVENAYGYNSEGKLLYAKNATVAPFRVMIQSPQDINIDRLNEDQLDPNGQVKVVRASDFIDDEPTAIENVADIDGNNIVDVYTIGGTQIKKNVKAAEALRNLPKGVYVVGGKKVVK